MRRNYIPLAIGLIALAIFLLTTSSLVLPGDAGEFQTLAATGGIAHAGYPALVMLLRLFGRIPISSFAFRANLVSCLSGAVAVGFAVQLALRMKLRASSAVCAGIALSLTRTLWSESTVAGVHAFTLAIDAALFIACLSFCRTPRGRIATLVGLLMGLGAVSHLTSLSLLPVILIAALMAAGSGTLRRSHLVGFLFGALLGLSPFLYLIIHDRPNQPMNYIADTLDLRSGEYFPAETPPLTRLERAEWLLSARQYLGHRGVAGIAAPRDRFMRIGLDLAFNGVGLVGILILIPGLLALWRKRSLAIWMLTAWFAGVIALVWIGASLEMAPIFFLPGLWIFALPLGAGLDFVTTRSRLLGWLACAAILAGPFLRVRMPDPPHVLAGTGAARGAWALWPQDWNPLARDASWDSYGRAVMARVEPKAVVLACWAHATPLRYFQYAEPLRPDVRVVFTCRNPARIQITIREAVVEGRPVYATFEPEAAGVGSGSRWSLEYRGARGGLWKLLPENHLANR